MRRSWKMFFSFYLIKYGKEFYKEYERRLGGFASCGKLLAVNVGGLTSVFGKGTGVSNLLVKVKK